MRQKVTVIREYVADDYATLAQKWFVSILNRSGLNIAQLAKKIHMSRQSVYFIADGHTKQISFPVICAICYVTGLDDPEEVWREISL